jgi:hypothetical protein
MLADRVRILFDAGEIYLTGAASDALKALDTSDYFRLLNRHRGGDWGDISGDMKENNSYALHEHRTLVSIYNLPTGEMLMFVTEGDRTRTTISLVGE